MVFINLFPDDSNNIDRRNDIYTYILFSSNIYFILKNRNESLLSINTIFINLEIQNFNLKIKFKPVLNFAFW